MGLFDWLRGRDDPPPSSVPAAPGEDDILASLAKVEEMLVAGRVSPLVSTRVARVDRLIRAILPRLPALGVGSADAYAVVATATDYLPETVGGYLRLPRDWADTRPIDGGRTALMVLVDQLELLGATMTKMLDAATQSDAEALIAHGRFLEAKFGHASTGGVLDVSTPGIPAPAPSPSPARSSAPEPAMPRSTNSLDLEP